MKWFADGTKRFEEFSLIDLIEAKNNKYIRLPIYQRDAVWSEGRICTLWDSILRGYPLPSFLITKGFGLSREFQPSKLDARGITIEDNTTDEYFNLLDGQQRLSAIDTVFSYNNLSTIRLWIDLAEDKPHPHKNKYWIHACTKIFPFGFSTKQGGEFDFSVMTDNELNDIWNSFHGVFNKDDFFEYPLEDTFPKSAKCPIPLDKLLSYTIKKKVTDINEITTLINRIVSETKEAVLKLGYAELHEPVKKIVENLSKDIESINEYRLGFQLLNLDNDDEYNLFERIGRGGIQITQRQLAVSIIMMLLGKEGNDSIAKFNQSNILKNLLETEDIIHAVARVAYTKLYEKDTYENDEGDLFSKDLIELTPQRLYVLKNDSTKWKKFKLILNDYCSGSDKCKLQIAYEKMIENISYKTNKNGFSKAQLAQRDKNADDDGIDPISLHPLLYWYINNLDKEVDINHSDNMIKWLLFVNGFIKNPKHPKLNRLVYATVVVNDQINFKHIFETIYNETNEQLRRDVGLIKTLLQMDHQKNELTSIEKGTVDLIDPQTATDIFKSKILLQNWVADEINWFILLWNQRELISHLYDDINYIPALYSKGRPFDLDHIVARNWFLYKKTIITDVMVKNALIGQLLSLDSKPTINYFKLTADNFRKNLPYSIANYRYWPRKLNRSDQASPVEKKMKINWIKQELSGNKLAVKFDSFTDDKLWEWCSIPAGNKAAWENFPPQNNDWKESTICSFFEEVIARHKYLYEKAYDFIKSP